MDTMTEVPQYDPKVYDDDPLVVACLGCGRATRKYRVKESERPDTVSWGGAGYCTRCYVPATRRPTPSPKQIDEQRAAHAATGLNRYMARREERLRKGSHAVPPQQTQTPATPRHRPLSG